MTNIIYSKYLETAKELTFIKQVVYYEQGVYTFSCYPITRIQEVGSRFTVERANAYSGYKVQIHTCNRRSKKNDEIAIEVANRFYQKNQITNY